MTWYNESTVTVTAGSPIVTVAGGNLISAGVAAGQGFQVHRTGDIVYDIASVDSATQMTLSRNYIGAGGSGLLFDVMPVLGPQRSAEMALREMIELFEGASEGPLAGIFAEGLSVAFGGDSRILADVDGVQLDGPVTGTGVIQNAVDMTSGKLLTTAWAGLSSPIQLVSGDDLDNELTFGLRAIASDDEPSNAPDVGSRLVLVLPFSSVSCLQLAFRITASSVSFKIHARAIVNSETGKAWEEISFV